MSPAGTDGASAAVVVRAHRGGRAAEEYLADRDSLLDPSTHANPNHGRQNLLGWHVASALERDATIAYLL